MPLTNSDFESLINDNTKRIEGDIIWSEDEDHSPAFEFRIEVQSEEGWPLFAVGSYNHLAGTLSYVLILKPDGRIYGLDLGKDHNNPQNRQKIGDKHKHRWTEQWRDKEAYVPEDITASVLEPLDVWDQFCRESKIIHGGRMNPIPSFQGDLFL